MPYTDKKISDLTHDELNENTWMVLSYVNNSKGKPNFVSYELWRNLMDSDLITNPWHYELTTSGKYQLKRLSKY